MTLKYLSFRTNSAFHKIIGNLKPIAFCNGFTEYVTPNDKLFVRLPDGMKSLQEPFQCLAYIEPQINMSATVRNYAAVYKLQISIVPISYLTGSTLIELSKVPFEVITFTDFIDLIKPCDSWMKLLIGLSERNESTPLFKNA